MIDRVRALVDGSDSLEELRDRLADMMTAPAGTDAAEAGLAGALRQAIAFAELTGRSDLDDGR